MPAGPRHHAGASRHHGARLVLALAVGAAALAGCGDDGPAAAPLSGVGGPVTVAEGPLAAVELQAGDCVTGIVIGTAERAQVQEVAKVACLRDHPLEVFATFVLDAEDLDVDDLADYPGTPRVVRAADRGCTALLQERRGQGQRDVEEYGLLALWPSSTSWAGGDREVACAVFSPDGAALDGPQFPTS